MTDNFIDLLELQSRLRDGLEGLFPDKLWVKAEIASIQVKSNGHCYMDLSQNDGSGTVAKARAVIWRGRYYALAGYFKAATGSDLQVGMMILLRVQVNYSELYGLTLVADELEPQFTLGQAELERQRTIETLEADGLLDRQKKELSLCALPYSLAVISARDAAGFGDFLRHLEGNEFGFKFRVELFEAAMQGSHSPESVSDAIQAIETSSAHYDAVLIIRGGGSNLDLACFDDYALCVTIANCSIPVITAIGHDRDCHVADMVAFDHVKTPTALADLLLDCYMAEDERISSCVTRLHLAISSRLSAMEARVDLLASKIASADPRSVLSRGYTLVTDSRGRVVKKASDLSAGDEVDIYLSDGKVRATIC